MRHCNSVFQANDIWFLLDCNNQTNRKLYLANCPICNKEMVLYSCRNNDGSCFEKYYYSNGARKIKEKFKKDVTSTMLGFKTKYKMPFGIKYGLNKEIIKKGKVVGVKQYACDFWGNKILVKKIENGK
ncbi:MAG: hypothetical protein IJW73_07415 [Candidatus Gastranaerophilales bacterium]|nr:hypothetical protein [Candidatus Gastranaerophilales bacterium]